MPASPARMPEAEHQPVLLQDGHGEDHQSDRGHPVGAGAGAGSRIARESRRRRRSTGRHAREQGRMARAAGASPPVAGAARHIVIAERGSTRKRLSENAPGAARFLETERKLHGESSTGRPKTSFMPGGAGRQLGRLKGLMTKPKARSPKASLISRNADRCHPARFRSRRAGRGRRACAPSPRAGGGRAGPASPSQPLIAGESMLNPRNQGRAGGRCGPEAQRPAQRVARPVASSVSTASPASGTLAPAPPPIAIPAFSAGAPQRLVLAHAKHGIVIAAHARSEM